MEPVLPRLSDSFPSELYKEELLVNPFQLPVPETHTTSQPTSKHTEQDLQLSITCMICNQTLTARSLIEMHGCGHAFCRQCLADYLEVKVASREVRSLTCPTFNCSTQLSDIEAETYLRPSSYTKYLRFRLELELESDPDLRWCPRPSCLGYDYCRGLKRKLTCNQCGFLFCRYCLSEWHGKTKCTAEIDHQFERWAHGAKVKFCPKCRMRVEKNEGCPHMTCIRCSYEWCWACGAAYSGHNPCPVRNPHWANQSWSKCLILFLLPVLFLFIFVIAALHSLRSVFSDSSVNWGFRVFLFLSVTLLTLALSPLGFAFVLPLSGIAFLIVCYDKCRCDDNCCLTVILFIVTLPLGLSLSPLIISIVFLGLALGPPIGAIMILMKTGVILIRCFKKDFLVVKGIPGYPIG